MLVALIVSLLMGGGSVELLEFIAETDAEIKAVVPDDARRDAARSTLKDMKKRVKVMHKQRADKTKTLNNAVKPHEVDETAIDALLAEHFTVIGQYNRDMINYRFQLKEQLTREEWQKLFNAE